MLQPPKTKIHHKIFQIRRFAHQESTILKQVSELSIQWSYACEIYFCPNMTHLIFNLKYWIILGMIQPFKTKIHLIFIQIRRFAHQQNVILQRLSELSVQRSYACETYFCPKMTHLVFYYEYLLMFGIPQPSNTKIYLIF